MVANESSGERKSKQVLFFPHLPVAHRTDPLTEGLEKAKSMLHFEHGMPKISGMGF